MNLKWYNILVIILLIFIIVAIIMLPNNGQNVSTGLCNMVCPNPQQEQKNVNEHFDTNKKIDKEPKPELVLYYATWCHFSREFLDDWSKFEEHAKVNLPQIRVMSVRCEGENEATCQQKGVKGYPTVIMYLVDGSEHKFEGERTVDGLKNFVAGLIR